MGAHFANPTLSVLMDDGAEHTVRVLNIDMLTWDRERARRHWPKGDEAPFVWMTFLSWHALKREGVLPDMTLPEFETRCVAVTSEAADDVDPTKPDPGED